MNKVKNAFPTPKNLEFGDDVPFIFFQRAIQESQTRSATLNNNKHHSRTKILRITILQKYLRN